RDGGALDHLAIGQEGGGGERFGLQKHVYPRMRRVRPVSRSITSIRTKTARMRVPETAATRTSSVLSIMPHIRIGSMSVRAEERKRETGTLSTEAMKARKAPAAIPG